MGQGHQDLADMLWLNTVCALISTMHAEQKCISESYP